MLFSISRSTTRRLVSTAVATSSIYSVVFRRATKLRFQSPGLYRPSYQIIRGLASAGRSKATSTLQRAKDTTAKKPSKKPTKTTKSKAKGKAQPKPKRTKKPISEERKVVLERQALKRTALFTEPKTLPTQAWQVFVVENTKGKGYGQAEMGTTMPSISRAYKELSSSEMQRIQSIADQNKTANAVAYKAWVESYTPEEIDAASRARKILKRKFGIPKGHIKVIHDDRQPKKPPTAFGLFTKARWASGELSKGSGSIGDAAREVAREWKNLSLAERQPYADLARSDSESYAKAVSTVLHREVRHNRKPPSP
ncbi:hypothetical protein F5Y19DRAFT_492989 [Xylariaceae sp. FL1651]|nr:hypothetical protein F5Y19DRAFT_492989 [Xylariaceae sp. FL1651]